MWWNGSGRSAIQSVLATAWRPTWRRSDSPGRCTGRAARRRDDVLRPAILWNDQRTDAECDAIREAVGPRRLIEITGNDALTGFTAPKLVWVRDHEPDVWRRVAHVLLPKDYVRLRLTGEHAVDQADGAGTLLFDLARRDWSPEVLAALELDPAWMPATFEGPEVTGVGHRPGRRRDGAPARDSGRRRRWRPGRERGGRRRRLRGPWPCRSGRRASCSPTDRAAHRAPRSRPCLLPCRPGTWHMMSVMLSAAGSLRWFRDAFGPGNPVRGPGRRRRPTSRRQRRALVPPLPDRRAQPAPGPARARRVRRPDRGHDRRQLVRAVLEGVAYGLRDGLDLMAAAGMPVPSQIRASGGGTASPLWRQILADVLGAEIATLGHDRGRGVRRRRAGRGRCGLVPERRGRDRARRHGHARGSPGPRCGAVRRGPRATASCTRARAALPARLARRRSASPVRSGSRPAPRGTLPRASCRG